MDLLRIRRMAKDYGPLSALAQMTPWLAPGDPIIMGEAKRLEQNISTLSETDAQARWEKLLRDIRMQPAQTKAFLNHYQEAESYFTHGEWGKAYATYQKLLPLYQASFSVKISDIQQKLKQAGIAQEMQNFIYKGNEAYLAKDWKGATAHFKQVLSLHQKGLGVDKHELLRVIKKCEQGITYQMNYENGQCALREGNTKQARAWLTQAIAMWETDFEPSQEMLQYELEQLPDQQATWMNWTASSRMKVALLSPLALLAAGGIWWMASGTHTATAPRISTPPAKEITAPLPVPMDTLPLSDNVFMELSVDTFAALRAEELPSETGPPVNADLLPFSEEAVLSGVATAADEALAVDSSSAPSAPLIPLDTVASTDTPTPSPDVDSVSPETSFTEAFEATISEAPEVTPITAPKKPLTYADQMPSFPGGTSQLSQFLRQHVDYPELARENAIQGTVYVQFIVRPNGQLTDARVVRGIGFGCNEEALKVVASMPRWQPGQHQGQVVPVIYTLPVTFKIH